MQQNENTTTVNVEEEGLDLRKILYYALAYWKVLLASLIVCVAAAFFYLRVAVPTYPVSAKILLNDQKKGGFDSSASMLAEFGFQSTNANAENEIEVIKSMSVIRGAVDMTKLNVSYAVSGLFTNAPIYADKSPLKVTFGVDGFGNVLPDAMAALASTLNMEFNLEDKSNIALVYSCKTNGDNEPKEYTAEIKSLPYTLVTPVGNVLIEKGTAYDDFSKKLLVGVKPLGAVALSCMKALAVAPISKTSSVATIDYKTSLPENGVAFINAVIDNYNNVTTEDKRQVARQTAEFILERIDSLSKELIVMERRLSDYKKQNELIAPELDAAKVTENKSGYTKQLEEIELVLKSSKFLKEFVNDSKNDSKVIPTTFGLTIDPSLLALINNYNTEVVALNQLKLSATVDNPVLKSSAARVEQMQSDLRVAIDAYDRSLRLQRDAVSALLASYSSRYAQSPEIERELITIERECAIKSELYVTLLQKYEENALSLAVSADNLRCIDAPLVGPKVSPNAKMVLLIAVFLAFALPALVIWLIETLRTKLYHTEEVEKLITVPHVGTIPFKKSAVGRKNPIVVEKNKNDLMTESFRAFRTNLQFVMKNSKGKIVMFTSTTSGEGKTFVACNLAVSNAMLGKKVLLMGLDIRRPRLAEMFKFDPKAEGFTSYLVGDKEDFALLDRLILHTGIAEGFDILPAGIVPPNPAELLSNGNLERALEYLSTKYDFIVLDTAPVGLVSDSFLISPFADAVIYVVRLGHTHKYDLQFMHGLVAEGKLQNVSLVVNGEEYDGKGGYGRYGYGRYGYGRYGYGRYGYGGQGYTTE